jgi:glycosidase
MIKDQKWWQKAVGYQIYPASFYDSNGDGIGDLKGIISKLDYLVELGVDLIWVCPFFKSPRDDNGYDISNHYEVDPAFGETKDMFELINEVHKRGMKIIFDFVLNHTSDEHPWFIEARSSKDNLKRDYYIWSDGKTVDGKRLPPNNWEGFFSDSAWAYDKTSDSFYLKIFSKKMPDLNWANPDLRQEMYKIARYYLDIGCDGFRLDAVAHLSKDLTFSDSTQPVNEHGITLDSSKFSNRKETIEYLTEFHDEVLSKYDCVTVGEVGGMVTPSQALHYASLDKGPLDMVFNFDTAWNNNVYDLFYVKGIKQQTKLVDMKYIFKKWFDACYGKAWLPLYWNNHDHPRVISQYGSPRFPKESGKMLGLVLLFMYGTPFIYNGEEIGMSNVNYDNLDDFNDVSDQGYIKELLPYHNKDDILKHLCRVARTNGHEIMQWKDTENAGFSTAKPWLKVNTNYKEVNVETEDKDKDSILNFYRKAIKIRKQEEILDLVINTNFELLDPNHDKVFAYLHENDKHKLVVIASFSEEITYFKDDVLNDKYDVLLHNYEDVNFTKGQMRLCPFEAMLLLINKE